MKLKFDRLVGDVNAETDEERAQIAGEILAKSAERPTVVLFDEFAEEERFAVAAFRETVAKDFFVRRQVDKAEVSVVDNLVESLPFRVVNRNDEEKFRDVVRNFRKVDVEFLVVEFGVVGANASAAQLLHRPAGRRMLAIKNNVGVRANFAVLVEHQTRRVQVDLGVAQFPVKTDSNFCEIGVKTASFAFANNLIHWMILATIVAVFASREIVSARRCN